MLRLQTQHYHNIETLKKIDRQPINPQTHECHIGLMHFGLPLFLKRLLLLRFPNRWRVKTDTVAAHL